MKKNSLFLFFLFLMGILPTIISSFITYILYLNKDFLTHSTGTDISIFFLIASFTMALALTPTTFIAIIAGYFFSWTGLLGVVISYILASTLGLLLGRALNRAGIKYSPKSGSKFERLLNNFGDKQFMLIAFARLSPVLPFAMTNVALSAIPLKWKNYLLGSILGMFPRTFLFFWTGKNASNIWTFISKPSLEGMYKLSPIILVIVSTAGLYFVIKNKMSELNKH
jgi:uncharacterized membrane protein YdjX (TVP38/TMEM64 family)